MPQPQIEVEYELKNFYSFAIIGPYLLVNDFVICPKTQFVLEAATIHCSFSFKGPVIVKSESLSSLSSSSDSQSVLHLKFGFSSTYKKVLYSLLD